jgi:hypothetical protein
MIYSPRSIRVIQLGLCGSLQTVNVGESVEVWTEIGVSDMGVYVALTSIEAHQSCATEDVRRAPSGDQPDEGRRLRFTLS